MKCYLPDIRLTSELPEQTKLEEKLGGVPWGLPAEDWPVCSDCDKPLSLLAQFVHDDARLDLGREGRVLFVFQCNHHPGMCAARTGGSGANACFILEPEELAEGLTPLPKEDPPPLDREVRIVSWREMDDGISELDSMAFFDEERYRELPGELLAHVPNMTHLGGVPVWIESPDEAPKDGWRFAGQLDSFYGFFTPPAAEDENIYPNLQKYLGQTHSCPGPNFGDFGSAYIFLNDEDEDSVPTGWFFWQSR